MNYPIDPYLYRNVPYNEQDERIFPVLPFLTGLAFGPFLYGALHPRPGYYHPYPPPPYYYPYSGYGYNPYFYNGYY